MTDENPRVLEYVLHSRHRIVAEVTKAVADAIHRMPGVRPVFEIDDSEGSLHNKRAYRFDMTGSHVTNTTGLWIYRHDDHYYITTERKDDK